MKVLTATVIALLAISGNSEAQPANPLAATYSTKVGDVAAATLSEFLKMRPDLRESAVVTYEPETGTIDLEIVARTRSGSTDVARAALGQYWEFIQAVHIPHVERRFKTKLTANHYRLVYYLAQTQGAPQVVLQFVNGQFLIP